MQNVSFTIQSWVRPESAAGTIYSIVRDNTTSNEDILTFGILESTRFFLSFRTASNELVAL
jgi:hypothetical protein